MTLNTLECWRRCQRAHVTLENASCLVLSFGASLRLVATQTSVTTGDVAELVDQLDRFRDVPQGTPTLYDLRLLEFERVETETVKYWTYLLSKAKRLQRSRAAFVVETEVGFGMSRMMQQLAEARGLVARNGIDVTYSLPGAVTSLRRPKQGALLAS